jgi:hypothetical protein
MCSPRRYLHRLNSLFLWRNFLKRDLLLNLLFAGAFKFYNRVNDLINRVCWYNHLVLNLLNLRLFLLWFLRYNWMFDWCLYYLFLFLFWRFNYISCRLRLNRRGHAGVLFGQVLKFLIIIIILLDNWSLLIQRVLGLIWIPLDHLKWLCYQRVLVVVIFSVHVEAIRHKIHKVPVLILINKRGVGNLNLSLNRIGLWLSLHTNLTRAVLILNLMHIGCCLLMMDS